MTTHTWPSRSLAAACCATLLMTAACTSTQHKSQQSPGQSSAPAGQTNGQGAGGGSTQPTGSLTIDMGFPGTTITRNFNPFSSSATAGTLGFMYECLFHFNVLQAGKFVPWLAKSYAWSDGGKKITIKLDPRATWSDGSPLTADDVVFTLDEVKQHNVPASWKFDYKTATAADPHTVVITFAKPSYTALTNIGNVTVVPKKIWQGKNPTTWTNPNPVGSGPYTLADFTPQQLTLSARTDYWKQPVPVKTLNMPVTAGGTSGEARLLAGQIEWSGGTVLNVNKVYVAKDPQHNHAWYPTYGALLLAFNVNKAPFNNVHVRKGISLALNRQQLSQVANPGLFYPMNPTGLDDKTQGKWIAPQYRGKTQANADPSAALAELAKAGYKKQGSKIIGPDGKQLSFDIKEESDFADSIERDKVLAQELRDFGIAVNVVPEPSDQFNSDNQKGNFDAVVRGAVYYATPYGFYNDTLNSANAGAWANWSGWKSKQTDQMLTRLAGANGDAQVLRLSTPLEKLMVDQVPEIPLISIGASTEYSTKDWTGWPNASNPYAIPAPWAGPPDEEQTVLGLHPAH